MTKILFLTQSYPDIRKSATILCTHRVMECMARVPECEVHCLCLQYDGEAAEETINNIHVHRFKDTWWNRIHYRCSVGKSLIPQRFYPYLQKLQKTLTIPFYPCTHPFLFDSWKKEANRLIEKEQFSIAIAEHHGYNTLMTGCYLKRTFPDIKFAAILWDPVKGQIQTVKLPKPFTEKRINAQEQELAGYADVIISTMSMKNYFQEHGDMAKDKRIYLDIPGVLPPDGEVSTSHLSLLKQGYINIVYSGLIGAPRRDPLKMLEILNRQKNVEKINIVFFCRGVSQQEQKRWEETFKGNICVHDYIPLQELHTIYRHADYLMNVSDINANMTPSKIFEYMSYGKPIISTYITDGDAAKRYLDEYPESCVIDLKNPIGQSAKQLEGFFGKEHIHVPFETVQTRFPINTPEKFVEVIKSMI